MNPFVDTTRIPVRDGDVIFHIKPRMDFGTRCRVEDTQTKFAMRGGKTIEGDLMFTIGAQKLALAIHNIVAWEGPGFTNVPCSPENIERLDPDYPALLKAQAEITRRNAPREDAPDPNDSTTTGVTSSQESETVPAVSSMSTSS